VSDAEIEVVPRVEAMRPGAVRELTHDADCGDVAAALSVSNAIVVTFAAEKTINRTSTQAMVAR